MDLEKVKKLIVEYEQSFLAARNAAEELDLDKAVAKIDSDIRETRGEVFEGMQKMLKEAEAEPEKTEETIKNAEGILETLPDEAKKGFEDRIREIEKKKKEVSADKVIDFLMKLIDDILKIYGIEPKKLKPAKPEEKKKPELKEKKKTRTVKDVAEKQLSNVTSAYDRLEQAAADDVEKAEKIAKEVAEKTKKNLTALVSKFSGEKAEKVKAIIAKTIEDKNRELGEELEKIKDYIMLRRKTKDELLKTEDGKKYFCIDELQSALSELNKTIQEL